LPIAALLAEDLDVLVLELHGGHVAEGFNLLAYFRCFVSHSVDQHLSCTLSVSGGVNWFLGGKLEAEVGGGQEGGDELGGVVEGGVVVVHGLLTVYAGRGGRCRGRTTISAQRSKRRLVGLGVLLTIYAGSY
jgi:hypothetical protein